MSKESVPTDTAVEENADREPRVDAERTARPDWNESDIRNFDGATDRPAPRNRRGESGTVYDRDGNPLSATELVFSMGSVPNDVDPQLEPEERDALATAEIDPDLVASKEYSYRMLLDAGVDEPLADEIRRRFSLPWSFETDGDLDRRSTEVRGLGATEREWIAASADDTWQTFGTGRSHDCDTESDDATDRPFPPPTPVTAVVGVGPADAATLAAGGVVSAERLATIDAVSLAAALDLDVVHLRTWRHNARELTGG